MSHNTYAVRDAAGTGTDVSCSCGWTVNVQASGYAAYGVGFDHQNG